MSACVRTCSEGYGRTPQDEDRYARRLRRRGWGVVEAYWDPMPVLDALGGRGWFRSDWEHRNWRNVPGPFYGAQNEDCGLGIFVASRHVVGDGEHGEIVYRQPRAQAEVDAVMQAANEDMWSGYGCDGDDHWTAAAVREWWADRHRVREWALASRLDRLDDPESAAALLDYAAYIDGELDLHLRGYLFWLNERRAPRTGESLPEL